MKKILIAAITASSALSLKFEHPILIGESQPNCQCRYEQPLIQLLVFEITGIMYPGRDRASFRIPDEEM